MFGEQAFVEQVFALSRGGHQEGPSEAHQGPSAFHQRFPEKLSAFGDAISAKEKSGASISRSLCYYFSVSAYTSDLGGLDLPPGYRADKPATLVPCIPQSAFLTHTHRQLWKVCHRQDGAYTRLLRRIQHHVRTKFDRFGFHFVFHLFRPVSAVPNKRRGRSHIQLSRLGVLFSFLGGVATKSRCA